MSKEYYLVRFIVGSIVAWLILSIHNDAIKLILGLPIGLYLLYVYIRFHQEMWESIQDKYVRTTPGRAAWFLLIPIFNLYWYFVVYPGFVENYNRYIIRRSQNVKEMSLFPFREYAVMHVFLVSIEYGYYAAMIIVSALSLLIKDGSGLSDTAARTAMIIFYLARYILIPFSILNIVFFIMIVLRVCDAVNALSATPLKAESIPVRTDLGGTAGDSGVDV